MHLCYKKHAYIRGFGDGFYEGQITCNEIVFVHAGTVLSTPRF